MLTAILSLHGEFSAKRTRGHGSSTTGPAWHLSDLNLVLIGATAAGVAAWFGVLLIVKAVTRPRMPAAGPKTMDLRPETPAVAEFLTGGWEVGSGALQATLLDLAARGALGFDQVGPDPRDTVIRLTGGGSAVPTPRDGHGTAGFAPSSGASGASGVSGSGDLRPYEKRVLHRITTLASGGVVPARALAQGTKEQDDKWHEGFDREVVAEARALGLSRPRYAWRHKFLLMLAACVPAVLAAAAAGHSRSNGDGVVAAGGVVLFGALFLVGSLGGDRETAGGKVACAEWLGVRDWIAADEQFRRLPPAAVAIWDRYLGYGAGFGITRTAIAALPLGARNERRAWSTYGGVWHEVKLGYLVATERRVRHPKKSLRLALRRIAAALVLVPGLVWIASHKVWRVTTPLPHGTDVKVFLTLGAAVALVVVSFSLFNVDGRPQKGAIFAAAFWVVGPGTLLWFVAHAKVVNDSYVIPHWWIVDALLVVSSVLALVLGWYLVLLFGALADLALREQVVGEVVRLREHGDERHVAVDPGGVVKVNAWPVPAGVYSSLHEGSVVSVDRGRWFGYVYSVQVTTASTRGNLFADPAGAA
jgi:hypothetical protein